MTKAEYGTIENKIFEAIRSYYGYGEEGDRLADFLIDVMGASEEFFVNDKENKQ